MPWPLGKRRSLPKRCSLPGTCEVAASLASGLSANGDSRMAKMTRRKCAFCADDEPYAIMYVSEEQDLAAHLKCLLFASGFVESVEQNPEDLNQRFDVDSVMKEIRRGRRLHCSLCHKKGATIGCEVRSCHKGFHYFCALRDGASMETDEEQGFYRLFCSNHISAKRSRVDDENRKEEIPLVLTESSSTTTRMVTPVVAEMTRRKCAFCADDEPYAIMYVSEEQDLAVHQKCLLFASGFVESVEQNPEDLNKRFDVDSVMKEMRRGRRLLCDGCQKRGATIDCKINTCDSSFHYFCALRDGASMETDEEQGCYRLFCSNHIPAKKSRVDGSSGDHPPNSVEELLDNYYDEDSENEMSPFVLESYSITTRMTDETVREENMELVSENHDQLKERIEFVKKCKQAGLLGEIFKKMLNTLHLAQEKLMNDNTSEAEYEEIVTLLFDCGLFENIRRAALSGTVGKIEELTNTRNRLDAEIESLRVLKEFSVSEDNTSSIISA